MAIDAWPEMKQIPLSSHFLLVGLVACSAADPKPKVEVSTWGTMREVLRNGESHGRVQLVGFGSAASIGVGALADLAGEVTIVDGRILVARGRDATGADSFPNIRDAIDGDAAALLVSADVSAWDEIPIGACADYDQLEQVVAKHLRARGHDLTQPQPIRVRGRAPKLAIHVIAGACPIANPNGPKPRRFEGSVDSVELVGFYVEGAAGRFTHHNHSSHLHAVAGPRMGHLDDVALEDAVLFVPTGP